MVFLVGALAVTVLIGVVESSMARLRLTHVPLLLVAACLLSAFGIVLLVR
jgi:formate hydrogenlyase subunit 4